MVVGSLEVAGGLGNQCRRYFLIYSYRDENMQKKINNTISLHLVLPFVFWQLVIVRMSR